MYLEAVSLSENGTEAHANLGHLYLSQKRYAEASKAFMKVREWQPDLLDVNLGLALASVHEGTIEMVRDMLSKVVDATCGTDMGLPREVTATDMAQLFTEAGRILVGHGQPQSAAFAFETGYILDPDSQAAGLSLAEVLRHQGDVWKAIEVYEKMIQASPDATLFRKLGACYQQIQADVAAEACEKQASELEAGKGIITGG